ncbi:MAG: hypothetical protein GY950_03145 [bacterium]|nr:hypothetical protein [bacterium]
MNDEVMMKHVECPKCQTQISLLQWLKAPTPWHLTCGNCDAKLKIRRFAPHLMVFALLFGMLLAMASFALRVPIPYFLLILLIAAPAVDVVLYYLLKKLNIDLEIKKNKTNEGG